MSRYARTSLVRGAVIAVMIVVIHVFQIVFSYRAAIFGVKPFLLTPAVICAAMYLTLGEGMAFSLILGLSCDAVSGGIFGKYALLLLVLVCVVFYLRENVTRRGAVAAVLMQALLYAAMTLYTLFAEFLIVANTEGLWTRIWNMWVEGAYSCLWAIPVFLIFRQLTRKFAKDE